MALACVIILLLAQHSAGASIPQQCKQRLHLQEHVMCINFHDVGTRRPAALAEGAQQPAIPLRSWLRCNPRGLHRGTSPPHLMAHCVQAPRITPHMGHLWLSATAFACTLQGTYALFSRGVLRIMAMQSNQIQASRRDADKLRLTEIDERPGKRIWCMFGTDEAVPVESSYRCAHRWGDSCSCRHTAPAQPSPGSSSFLSMACMQTCPLPCVQVR